MTIELPSQQPMLQAVGEGIQAFANVERGVAQCFGAMLGEDCPFGGIILEAAGSSKAR